MPQKKSLGLLLYRRRLETGGGTMTPEEAKKTYIDDLKFRALVKTMVDLMVRCLL